MKKIGTNIVFAGEDKGTAPKARYRFIASTKSDRPDEIIINKHPYWLRSGQIRVINSTINICSHEPLHQIMWKEKLDFGNGTLDVGIRLFKDKMNKKYKIKKKELYYCI
jgi:hypothetical protein